MNQPAWQAFKQEENGEVESVIREHRLFPSTFGTCHTGYEQTNR